MSKYLLLVISVIGMVCTGLSAIFHGMDGDTTGSMTWTLAFFVNGAVFLICLMSIREQP